MEVTRFEQGDDISIYRADGSLSTIGRVVAVASKNTVCSTIVIVLPNGEQSNLYYFPGTLDPARRHVYNAAHVRVEYAPWVEVRRTERADTIYRMRAELSEIPGGPEWVAETLG